MGLLGLRRLTICLVVVALLLIATAVACRGATCMDEMLVAGGDAYDDFGCVVDVTPDGRVWVVWTGYDPVQMDEEVFYTIYDEGAWLPARRVHPDNSRDDRFPQISVGEDGIPWVVWNGPTDDGYKIRVSHWEGGGWSSPEVLREGAARYDHYDLLSFDSSDVWFVTDAHVEGSNYREILVYRWDGLEWLELERLGWPDAIDQDPDFGVHPGGRAWVAWNAWYFDDNESWIACSAWTDTGWTIPEIVDDHPCDIGLPQLAFDGADPLVLWVGNGCTGTQTDVEYSVRRGGVWYEPALVNLPDGYDDYDDAPECEGSGGGIWVTWIAGYTPMPSSPDVMLARWTGDCWSSEQKISADGQYKTDTFPDLAISPVGGAWVVWQCDYTYPAYDVRATYCNETTPVDFAVPTAVVTPSQDAVLVSWYAGGGAAGGPFRVWRVADTAQQGGSVPPIEAEPLNEVAVTGAPYEWTDTGVSPGSSYSYWVEWERAGGSSYLGPVAVQVPSANVDVTVRILHTRPNPSRSGACVSYEQFVDGAVAMDVFDVTGRLVRRVAAGREELGSRRVERGLLCWDGEGSDGSRVASGVYLLRLLLDGRPVPEQTARTTIVR